MYEADWGEIRARYLESEAGPLEEYFDALSLGTRKKDNKEKEAGEIPYEACAGYDSDEISSEEETFTQEQDSLKIKQLQSRVEELETLAQQRTNRIFTLQQRLNVLQATALRQANELAHRQSSYNPVAKNTHSLGFFPPTDASCSISRNSRSAKNSNPHL
jgi:hypothetical protein